MKIGFLTSAYPWITQTFTYHEVRWWREYGLEVEVLSFKRPNAQAIAALTPEMRAEIAHTTYLSELTRDHWRRGVATILKRPRVTLRGVRMVLTQPYLRFTTRRLRVRALLTWLRSVSLAALVQEQGYDHLHADFTDETATAALLVHQWTGIDFSMRSHTSYNPQLLPDKLRHALFVLSIANYDKRYLERVAGEEWGPKVVVNYLGVNDPHRSSETSSGGRDETLILCVGTLQEKKGQLYLVRACARLQRDGVRFRCRLVGDGPSRGLLEQEIRSAGLEHQVQILGYRPHDEIRRLIAQASVMCLPCIVADNGDLDGIPIVLMEAMAAGTPCVTTGVSGIPELIEHDVDGWLVPERDPVALARSLAELLQDARLRRRLGTAAREKIQKSFNSRDNARDAVDIFRERLGITVAQAR